MDWGRNGMKFIVSEFNFGEGFCDRFRVVVIRWLNFGGG